MINNPGFTLLAAAALPAHRLVTAAGALATASTIPAGVTTQAIANGARGLCRFLTAGTILVEAGGAIDALATVYQAADGKVVALPAGDGTYRIVGTARTAATDGAVIEVIPQLQNGATVVGS
jgi:hypothetical protein